MALGRLEQYPVVDYYERGNGHLCSLNVNSYTYTDQLRCYK